MHPVAGARALSAFKTHPSRASRYPEPNLANECLARFGVLRHGPAGKELNPAQVYTVVFTSWITDWGGVDYRDFNAPRSVTKAIANQELRAATSAAAEQMMAVLDIPAAGSERPLRWYTALALQVMTHAAFWGNTPMWSRVLGPRCELLGRLCDAYQAEGETWGAELTRQ